VIGSSLPIYYPPVAGGESCGGPEGDSDPQLIQEDGLQGGAGAGLSIQCGSGIRCLFDPWIRHPGWAKKSGSVPF